jgi:hypothetical protein
MRGADEDGELVPPSATDVRVRATLHRPSSGAEIAVIDVDNGDACDRMQYLVIAERVEDGYRVRALVVGAQDLTVSESEGDVRLIDVASRWESDVLVVTATTATNQGSYDTDESGYCSVQVVHSLGDTMSVLCRGAGVCVAVVTEHDDSGEQVERECEPGHQDDEGEGDPPPESHATTVSVRIHVDGDAVVAEGDTDDALLAPGRHPLDDLDGEPLEAPAWITD